MPGFCDSHVHLVWYGTMLLRQADLVGSASVEEVIERLRALPGAGDAGGSGWVRGHGFDQDKLAGGRTPTRADLDAAFPDTPVVISRVCGHAAVVNSAALARVSAEARAAGDADSGLYTEGDAGPFYRAVPRPTEGEYERAVLAACDVALRSGVTSVHTLLESADQMGAFQRLHRRGELPIRVTAIPPWSAVDALHAHGVSTGFGDEWLRFGPCKLFSDGSFGARTAWVEDPYADDPSTRGLRIHDPADLKRKCVHAAERGWSLAIHAIGDAALRETLDALDAALDATAGDNAHWRHRVEHASLCPPALLERLAARKIVATLQPQFVTSDTWTAARLGPSRSRWAYPFRDLLDAGVPVSLGSDCPVERTGRLRLPRRRRRPRRVVARRRPHPGRGDPRLHARRRLRGRHRVVVRLDLARQGRRPRRAVVRPDGPRRRGDRVAAGRMRVRRRGRADGGLNPARRCRSKASASTTRAARGTTVRECTGRSPVGSTGPARVVPPDRAAPGALPHGRASCRACCGEGEGAIAPPVPAAPPPHAAIFSAIGLAPTPAGVATGTLLPKLTVNVAHRPTPVLRTACIW